MNLYWVDGPWPGRLALASRPYGGDWLEDEISRWRQAGVDTVLSLLTVEEEHDLGLNDEEHQVKSQGMQFLSFPIPDRDVPESKVKLAATLEKLEAHLASGKNVVVHCRQGIGRTGLITACLLVLKELSPEDAVNRLSKARGIPVPETTAQRSWIDHFAATMASK